MSQITRSSVNKALVTVNSDPRRRPTQMQAGLLRWVQAGGKTR